MIILDNTIVSEDFRSACFACDLSKCKGACCIEGDAGAPLDEEEISILEDSIDYIYPYMTPEGTQEVQRNGVFDFDAQGNYVTPLINGADCAYVYKNEEGIALCAIEKAYSEGKITWRKPVSCHLYPVRISRYKSFDALNYHEWHICHPAVINGKERKIKALEFVREALIRKYGADYYERLKTEFSKK